MNTLFVSLGLIPLLLVSSAYYQIHYSTADIQELEGGDCLLVLGAKMIDDQTPDLMMKERVETAVELIGPSLRAVILSGGSEGSNRTEAELMRDLLVKQGVSEEFLHLETKSTSTHENLLYSKPMIEDIGCQKLDILSHRFHLPRVRMTAEYLKIPLYRLIPAVQKDPDPEARLIRELKAYLWYQLQFLIE